MEARWGRPARKRKLHQYLYNACVAHDWWVLWTKFLTVSFWRLAHRMLITSQKQEKIRWAAVRKLVYWSLFNRLNLRRGALNLLNRTIVGHRPRGQWTVQINTCIWTDLLLFLCIPFSTTAILTYSVLFDSVVHAYQSCCFFSTYYNCTHICLNGLHPELHFHVKK